MATVYFSSDMTFGNLQNLVLRELKEPEATGSEACPIEMVKDKLNEVYADVFNNMNIKASAREESVAFNVVPDDSLAAAAAEGDTSLVLNDSSNFRSSGKVLLQSEIVTYSANNTLTNTLTVTALKIAHTSGEVVQQMYPLTIGTNVDTEMIQLLTVNGIAYTPMDFDRILNINYYTPFIYAVYQSYFVFARGVGSDSGGEVGQGLLLYTQTVTPLSADADKPTLIPNRLRIPLLVYGAAMKIAASDSFRTSWDWWDREYKKALDQYIALKNVRTRDRANRSRPTLYGRFL